MDGVMRHLPSLLATCQTPSYVVDIARLKRNLSTAKRIKTETGCKILLATKAFALPAVFPLMAEILDGTTASGLFEARLGREEFGREVHVYSPAYKQGDFEEIMRYADHIYFNSPEQVSQFLPQLAGKGKKIGIRINPGFSNATVGGHLYNPCAPCSRFGTHLEDLARLPSGTIDILHAHTLCESMHEGSRELIETVTEKFGSYVEKVKAVNFGGGHYFNKAGYDVSALITAIKKFRARFPKVEVIFEPGAALVYDAGYLIATVLDLAKNEKEIAILDASASCHMPDVLEVPYTPHIVNAGSAGEFPYTYILAGNTCMTGDVIGEYSFREPLKRGDQVIFTDMLQYCFVKNNMFNGTALPQLALLRENGSIEQVSKFDYEDYRGRLGYKSSGS